MRQEEIAEVLGILPSTWSNYERDASSPNLNLFQVICDYFGVSETDLLRKDLANSSLIEKSENNEKASLNASVNASPSEKIRTDFPQLNEAEAAHSFGIKDLSRPGNKKELVDAIYAGLLAFTAEFDLQKRLVDLETEVKDLKSQVQKS